MLLLAAISSHHMPQASGGLYGIRVPMKRGPGGEVPRLYIKGRATWG